LRGPYTAEETLCGLRVGHLDWVRLGFDLIITQTVAAHQPLRLLRAGAPHSAAPEETSHVAGHCLPGPARISIFQGRQSRLARVDEHISQLGCVRMHCRTARSLPSLCAYDLTAGLQRIPILGMQMNQFTLDSAEAPKSRPATQRTYKLARENASQSNVQ